jgi:hypothetical protein
MAAANWSRPDLIRPRTQKKSSRNKEQAEMKTPMVRRAIVGLAWLVAGSATAAAAPSSVVSMEEPQPGDHWTYEIRDEITGETSATRENVITEVTPTDISVRFRSVGTSPNEGFTIYDRSWNLTTSQPWKYSPNDGTGIKAPLAVGKTWAFRCNEVNAGAGVTWNRSGTSKVVAEEGVTTRAGTFQTFKIETSYSNRNVADPSRQAEITSVTWYAPAIDHWVKRTFISHVDKHVRVNNTIELVDYGRKK